MAIKTEKTEKTEIELGDLVEWIGPTTFAQKNQSQLGIYLGQRPNRSINRLTDMEVFSFGSLTYEWWCGENTKKIYQ